MFGDEVVRVMPDTIMDENNDPVSATGTDVEYHCDVDQLDGAELEELGRSGSSKGIRVYFPADAVEFSTTATLMYRGLKYNVQSVSFWANDDPDLAGPVAVATYGKG